MRSFPRTVVSTFGLAILLIAGPAHCSPTSEQANKADDPKIMEPELCAFADARLKARA